MILKEIYPHIYLAKYSNQYELTATFMRAQEFYESPFDNIRGKYFTYESFIDAYIKNGKLSYWSDWAGFNIPGESIHYFYLNFKDELTVRERDLFKNLSSLQDFQNTDYYLIGVYRNQDLSHEIAHAFYYLNEKYRYKANKLIASLSPKEFDKRCRELATTLYTPEVFMDEIQAYAVSNKERNFLKLYNQYRKN